MILYISGSSIVTAPLSTDDVQVEVDNHEILKHIWNNGTMSERQALLDALPKIQVISVAGTIE